MKGESLIELISPIISKNKASIINLFAQKLHNKMLKPRESIEPLQPWDLHFYSMPNSLPDFG